MAALAVVTNMATNAIPASWTWAKDGRICWSAVGVLAMLSAVLAWRAARASDVDDPYVDSPSAAWPLLVPMIPQLADCFQERQVQSDLLDRVVVTRGTGVVTQVLSGLRGTGKTQLAAACARQVWRDRGVDLLVWATASSRETIQATYAQAAAEIGWSSSADIEHASKLFLGWLQTTTVRWMVVLDDLRDPADLQGLWPNGTTGRVLVTTQRRDATLNSSGRHLVPVGLYTSNEAVAYLRRKITGVNGSRLNGAAELASDLGYLPLALAQAAAFIQNNENETCVGYCRRLREQRLSDVLPRDALADDYRSTVATTWSISVELADRLGPVGLARPTLQFASGLDPNGAPIDVFTAQAALSYLTKRRDAFIVDGHHTSVVDWECQGSLNNLHRLNLLTVDRSAKMVCTHALVQRATFEELSSEAVLTTVRAVANALVEIWPSDVRRDTTDLGRVLRDCAASLRRRYGRELWSPNAHWLLFRAGFSRGTCGLLDAATIYWAGMVSDGVGFVGPDHRDTLLARYHLAYWQHEAGDHAGSANAFRELLTDMRRVLGSDHPFTLATRKRLARLE